MIGAKIISCFLGWNQHKVSDSLERLNLIETGETYLRGKRYENEKKIWGAMPGNKNAKKRNVQNDNSVFNQPKSDLPDTATSKRLAEF